MVSVEERMVAYYMTSVPVVVIVSLSSNHLTLEDRCCNSVSMIVGRWMLSLLFMKFVNAVSHLLRERFHGFAVAGFASFHITHLVELIVILNVLLLNNC